MNTLFFGDNLRILRDHVPDETADLVYLDPPFNSNATYNVLFAEESGSRSAAQITAFEDTWHWGEEAAAAYHEMVTEGPGRVSDLLGAYWKFLGPSAMMAYLAMMAPRLVELHRAMKPTASIYLHCDPTASHYLKLLMDAVFAPQNFRNEIIWKRTTAHSDSKTWSRVNDSILFYTKSDGFRWNPPHADHAADYIADKYRYTDPDGRRYRLDNITSPNPRPNMMYEWMGFPHPPKGWRFQRETMQRLHDEGRIWYPTRVDGSLDTTKRPQVRRYLDEMPGSILTTNWTDIPPINSQAQERLGYPTQKPEALLERILQASSNEGDVVLDPFCGCGTTIAVAERLRRQWIGIDITHLAIAMMKHRLEAIQDHAPFQVSGVPTDLAGAHALAAEGRHQFEWWAVGLVGARPAGDRKKGADRGIDGVLPFFDDDSGKPKQILVSVKSGSHVNVSMVRDLRGAVEREAAAIGVLVTLHEPTGPMLTEATSAGFYAAGHPRLQVLTIEQLLAGKRISFPAHALAAAYKRAPERYRNPGQGSLGL